MKKSLYDILGVKKNSKKSDIKKSFRNKVKLLHPDLNKDIDNEEFSKIKEAYDILTDDIKRKMYDETGVVCDDSLEKEVYEKASTIFKDIIFQNIRNIKYVDVFKKMQVFLDTQNKEFEKHKKKIDDNKVQIEDIISRIEYSENKNNMFSNVLNLEIEMMSNELQKTDKNIMINNLINDIITKYSYKVDLKEKHMVFDFDEIYTGINL